MDNNTKHKVIEGLSLCGVNCHRISQEHGFWTPSVQEEQIMAELQTTGNVELMSYYKTQCRRNFGEALMLIVSEAAEALEVARKNFDAPAEHLDPKEFTHVEEELADIIIRVMDLAYGNNLSLGAAVVAKMEYNESRSYKHGKKF